MGQKERFQYGSGNVGPFGWAEKDRPLKTPRAHTPFLLTQYYLYFARRSARRKSSTRARPIDPRLFCLPCVAPSPAGYLLPSSSPSGRPRSPEPPPPPSRRPMSPSERRHDPSPPLDLVANRKPQDRRFGCLSRRSRWKSKRTGSCRKTSSSSRVTLERCRTRRA